MHLPKLDLLYNPLLDGSEHAYKSSKDGSFVNSVLNPPLSCCTKPNINIQTTQFLTTYNSYS